MRRTLTALAALAIAVVVAAPAAATSVTLPDQETCTPSDGWVERAVEHEYVKEVAGRVQVDLDPTPGRWWVDTGRTFGWEVWSGGSTQWSEQVVDVLEQGPHSATQATWSERGITYRKVTTAYRYVPTGQTRDGRVIAEHPPVVCPDPEPEPDPEPTPDPEPEPVEPQPQPEPAVPAVAVTTVPTFTG